MILRLVFTSIAVLICVGIGAFLMWVYYKIKKEGEISDFIRENLNDKDREIYEEYLDEYEFDYVYKLTFLKYKLSDKNFKEFLKLSKIKTNIKEVKSTEGLFEIDGEVYKMPNFDKNAN